MTVALLCFAPVSAKTTSNHQVKSATNPDGSALRIATTTNEGAGSRRVKVYYRSHPDRPMQLIWKKQFSLSESLSSGVTQIVDWNHDGINDVAVTLTCGAGADCETQHYNIDQRTRRMTPVGVTYGITRVISGYLVDMGRNNCCSWIGTAHRLSADRQRFDPEGAFSVFVAADKDAIGDKPAKCYFFKETGQGEQVIPAPTQALKQLCRWYD
ncbi:MAG: hypothetical protein QUV35_12930 [Hydrogenophaga sp.]|uniref:hypothetical protein n=1 Tax=Hydrogenophaga sp. TaxID=1904254 RepID=UPI0026324A51|nr:hypothetical protein [Hydrogenophaga sp.]MDM7943521.1 hypothetical protein [Hydrogenophaga sp.]